MVAASAARAANIATEDRKGIDTAVTVPAGRAALAAKTAVIATANRRATNIAVTVSATAGSVADMLAASGSTVSMGTASMGVAAAAVKDTGMPAKAANIAMAGRKSEKHTGEASKGAS